MQRTQQSPEYFHRVVDCQYACPAHTPVPEYIRLIAEQRYTEAYMVNRHSNVFPGILGRVCDRPCEPACRRGRVEEKPVAICRLKRVTSDYKSDIKNLLPVIPKQKNNKRIALIGAGPASLTVANDLMPLGYSCELFEKQGRAGGAMLSQVPAFRLPESVLNEETQVILDFGVKTFFGTEITSLKKLLEQNYDAVFVGVGAPLGKDLNLPGRTEAGTSVNIGVEFLANIAFGHRTSVAQNVIVIGGGNTAMDCARTALRTGAKHVTVIAPEAYTEMLASPWEKEDAEHEGIVFQNYLLPQEFVVQDNKLVGIRFRKLVRCYDEHKNWSPVYSSEPDVTVSCDEVILAIGQKLSLDFIDPELNLVLNEQKTLPFVNPKTYQSSHPQIFFGGDCALGPKNIITAVAQAHEAAWSIHQFCQNQDVNLRPVTGMNLVSQKMSMNQWSYKNDYDQENRTSVPMLDLPERFHNRHNEVELGFDVNLALREAKRCLNCDIQTYFTASRCIECDACVDVCPVQCLTMTADDFPDEQALRTKIGSNESSQQVFVDVVPQTNRLMVKDENLCLHCGLCAERCPTAAWDMQKFTLRSGLLAEGLS